MVIGSFTLQSDDRQHRLESFAFVIAAVLSVLFSFGFAASDFSKRLGQPYKIKLDEQINPNDAPVASLIRLPGIGILRAKAIVAYRENFARQNNGGSAFQNCDDLMKKVKGIGPKTVQNIREWLRFD